MSICRIYLKNCLNLKVVTTLFMLVISTFVFPYGYNYRNFTSNDGFAHSFVYSINQDYRGYLWIGTGNGLSRYNGFKFENFTSSESLAENFITCGLSDGEGQWFGHMNGSLTYFNGKKFHPFNLVQSISSPITGIIKGPDGQIWAGTLTDGLLKLNWKTGVVKRYKFKDQVSIVTFEYLDKNTLLIGTNTNLLYCKLKESGEIEIIGQVKEIPESRIISIIKKNNSKGYYIATENEGIFQITYNGKLITASKIITGEDFSYAGIQDIYEDSKSNLWLASFGNGLIKLTNSANGEFNEIEYFNKASGFATDNVKSIFEDREGNIWSGNYGDGLTQITPRIFTIKTFNETLYGNNISSIYINGKYKWIGTENGLVKTERETGKLLKFYGRGRGLPKVQITSIHSNDGKVLWIGTEKNGTFRLNIQSGKILKFPLGFGALENSITSITGKKNQVWIGTKKGLCNINLSTKVKKWYLLNEGGLPHNYINCLYIDRKEKLWISTRSNTLAYIYNDEVFKIPVNSVNRNITLGPITEDSNNQIWVGSSGQGIFLIKSDSIANLTVNQGLLSDYCNSIICDANKNIWVGHNGGLSKIRLSDFSVKPIQLFEKITDNYEFNQNSITKDEDDKIEFGSSTGLISYDPAMEHSQLQAPVLGITSVKINDEEKDYTENINLSPGNYRIKIEFIGINLKEPALVRYQYKLDGYEQWSEITRSTSITYNQLMEGEYKFILKAYSGDGAVSENPVMINILIDKPLWKKWWFLLISFAFLSILMLIYIKHREHKFQVEKKILEEKVTERTLRIQIQKNEIENQRDLIEIKNANITSSIKYARHIQDAVFPPVDLLNKLLPDNFLFSKPKDIVSGDFYWLTEIDNKIVFTVADCTGHGVPGAFMSVLGITLLSEIVNIQGITQSDAIVTKLRERVIQSLQQGRKDVATYDGMDISLCVLDRQKSRIQFTGGMNNIAFIRNGNMEIIKADRTSVCSIFGSPRNFTLKEFDYKKGDIIYLFTDGYKDQFGGIYDRKYLSKMFYQTLKEIYEFPMKEQGEILEKILKEWMKEHSQTDDITVLGIRF